MGSVLKDPSVTAYLVMGTVRKKLVEWHYWCLEVAPPMESQHYVLWVKLISRKRQLVELPD